jgi:hypothetical protein
MPNLDSHLTGDYIHSAAESDKKYEDKYSDNKKK